MKFSKTGKRLGRPTKASATPVVVAPKAKVESIPVERKIVMAIADLRNGNAKNALETLSGITLGDFN